MASEKLQMHPVPDEILVDMRSGYSVNVPAEWQDPNRAWWRNRAQAEHIMRMRSQAGVQLHDALWAFLNGQPEPSPTADSYSFDPEAGTYTRTDARV